MFAFVVFVFVFRYFILSGEAKRLTEKNVSEVTLTQSSVFLRVRINGKKSAM